MVLSDLAGKSNLSHSDKKYICLIYCIIIYKCPSGSVFRLHFGCWQGFKFFCIVVRRLGTCCDTVVRGVKL